MMRRQLPVASPIPLAGMARGMIGAITARADVAAARSRLKEHFGAREVILTDGGTSALVLALQLSVPTGGVAALPGYGCPALLAAALRARVKVSLYDVDPFTLSPDIESLRRVLQGGVNVLVIAPLYSMPPDMPAIRSLAGEHGVAIIEDAAQGLGGATHGRRLGTWGDLTVLSFGRGKELTAGRAGALLVMRDMSGSSKSDAFPAADAAKRGWDDLMRVSAQWLMGRPSVYGFPASIPALRLGQTIFQPAHDARTMSAAAVAMLLHSLDELDEMVSLRQTNARRIEFSLSGARDIAPCSVGSSAKAGYLRFPVLALKPRSEVPQHGIVRGYPRLLSEYEEARSVMTPVGEREPLPGCSDLRDLSFTLPTHHLVRFVDHEAIAAWAHASHC